MQFNSINAIQPGASSCMHQQSEEDILHFLLAHGANLFTNRNIKRESAFYVAISNERLYALDIIARQARTDLLNYSTVDEIIAILESTRPSQRKGTPDPRSICRLLNKQYPSPRLMKAVLDMCNTRLLFADRKFREFCMQDEQPGPPLFPLFIDFSRSTGQFQNFGNQARLVFTQSLSSPPLGAGPWSARPICPTW